MSPRWRNDGGEIFYLAPDGTMMAVSMTWRNGQPQPSVPAPLFKSGLVPSYHTDHYAVGPDGKTFLLRVPTDGADVPRATLFMNWLQ